MSPGMIQIVNHFVLQSFAMALTAALIPNLRITSIFGPIIMVVALAGVNATLWDAALFFNIPDSINSHVAVMFLSNGLVFWILVKLLPGIEVDGFLAALIAPVIFTALSIFIYKHGRDIDWNQIYNQALQIFNRVKEFIGQPAVNNTVQNAI